MRKIKIYYFAHSQNAPSIRYRGKYILAYLKQKYNIPYLFINPIGLNFLDFKLIIRILFDLFVYNPILGIKSVIIFQKICFKNKYLLFLKFILFFHQRKTIYDIDDAIYLIRSRKTIDYFLKKSGMIFVGSHYLLEYAKKFNSNCHFITTPIISHNIIKKGKNKKINIGWVGIAKAHKKNLFDLLFPILQKIHFPFILSIIGATEQSQIEKIKNFFIKNKNIELYIPLNINWEKEEEILNEIIKFDIGLSPLENNEANQARSAFKAKQYLSCGIPVLGSPIGENINYIKSEKNGFLCSDENDFIKYINYFYSLPTIKYPFFINNARTSYLNFRIDKIGDQIKNLIERIPPY